MQKSATEQLSVHYRDIDTRIFQNESKFSRIRIMFKSDLFPICFATESSQIPMNPTITSRELLAEVGASMEENPDLPLCYRPLLITSVITFVPARKLQKALNDRGEVVSYKDVLEWQRATREWLGLPEVSRGKPSDECKDAVKKWLRENGNPTPEEIDAGWLPLHLRGGQAVNTRELSPRYRSMFKCFRNQVDRLKSLKRDEDAWDLLKEILSSESN